jgi:hypothetical protein
MNTVKKNLREMVDAAMKTKSGPTRLLNFDPSGAGHRIYPADSSKSNSKWEIRLDAGEPWQENTDYVAVNLQINREAKTKGLKDLVKKNGTHYTYATAWVNVKEPPTKAAADKLVDDLEASLKD